MLEDSSHPCANRKLNLQTCTVLSHLAVSDCDPMDCSLPDSSVHGDSPGKNTRMGCHALLKGIFPTQGRSPSLQADSLPTETPGKPLYKSNIY